MLIEEKSHLSETLEALRDKDPQFSTTWKQVKEFEEQEYQIVISEMKRIVTSASEETPLSL